MARTDDTLLAALPHAPPFRFVSRLNGLRPGVSAEGVWNVDGDEEFLKGHFPGNPIVPGVLLIEALAQLSGLVAGAVRDDANGAAEEGRLAHVDIRFLCAVKPPAEVVLKSSLSRSLGGLHQFAVEALVHDLAAARGTLTLALGTDAREQEALKCTA